MAEGAMKALLRKVGKWLLATIIREVVEELAGEIEKKASDPKR